MVSQQPGPFWNQAGIILVILYYGYVLYIIAFTSTISNNAITATLSIPTIINVFIFTLIEILIFFLVVYNAAMGKTKTPEESVQELTQAFGGALPAFIETILRDELEYEDNQNGNEVPEWINKQICEFCDTILDIKSIAFHTLTVYCGYEYRLLVDAPGIIETAHFVNCELLYIGSNNAYCANGYQLLAANPHACAGTVGFECSNPLAAIILVQYLMTRDHCVMFNWSTLYKHKIINGELTLCFDTESG